MTTGNTKPERAQIHAELDRLLDIMERLRSPDGCPWDRAQTRRDVAVYLMDEACEVVDAVHDGSPDDIKEELGDLFFQILFFARMAEEEGQYDLGDVMAAVGEKMIRRHPHVFGNGKAETVDDIRETWEAIKRKEKDGDRGDTSLAIDAPRSLPPLNRAWKITKKAAQVGFDWPSIEGVIEKVEEELMELKDSLEKDGKDRVEEELGDLLFSLVNLSRHAGVHPDSALRCSIQKFMDRFSFMERQFASEGGSLESSSLDELDRMWELSKQAAKNGEAS